MNRFRIILGCLICLSACASDSGGSESSPPVDPGTRLPAPSVCAVDNHNWILETLEAGGVVHRLSPQDNIESVLQGMEPTQIHALILDAGTYGAATIPAELDLKIVGHCDTPVIAAPWQAQINTLSQLGLKS